MGIKIKITKKVSIIIFLILATIAISCGIFWMTYKEKQSDISTSSIVAKTKKHMAESNVAEEITTTFADEKLYQAICYVIDPANIVSKDDTTKTITLKNNTVLLNLPSYGITDLSGIEKLTSLQTINLYDNQISDITPLTQITNLKEIYIGNNQISDISKLDTMNLLTTLQVSYNKVTDINVIKNLNQLKYLEIAGNDLDMSDLNNISTLINLTHLDISQLPNSINLNMLQNLTNLEELLLNGNKMENMGGLNRLTNLKYLSISSIGISSIVPLVSLSNLERLQLSYNQIQSVEVLQNLTNLKEIDISNNVIKSIKCLENLTNLETLDASGNEIQELADISKMTKLKNFAIERQYLKSELIVNQNNKNYEQNIPTILKETMNESSRYYSSEGLELTNTTLSNDKNKMIFDANKLVSKQVSITVKNGLLKDTTYTIKGINVEYLQQEAITRKYLEEFPLDINENGIINEEDKQYLIDYITESTNEIEEVILNNISLLDLNNDYLIDNTDLRIYENYLSNSDLGMKYTLKDMNKTTKDEVIARVITNSSEITFKDDITEHTFYTNGNYEFIYMTKDGQENSISCNVDCIDKEPASLVVQYTPELPTSGEVVVKITSNEEIQEVEGYTLSEDKMSLTKTFTQNATETITIKDLAGNEITQKIQVNNIDKTLNDNEPPYLEVTYSTRDFTKEDVVVTITSYEPVQQVEGWTLSEDKLILTKTYGDNVSEDVIVKDIRGNASTTHIEIDFIDKVPLTASITYDITDQTSKNVMATITASKPVEPIEGWEMSRDRTVLRKVYDENVDEQIPLIDKVGTILNIHVLIQNMDKLPPEAIVEYSTIEDTNKDVIVTIKVNEEIQPVEGWELSNDKMTLTKIYTQNGQENIILIDKIGNITIKEISVQNIDKSPLLTEKSKYQITEDGYILNVDPETTKEQFEKNFGRKIKLQETDIIKTGMIVRVAGSDYIIIVKGDINQDGKASILDLAKIKKHLVEIEVLEDNSLKAADINMDGKVSIIDLAKIKLYITGLTQL